MKFELIPVSKIDTYEVEEEIVYDLSVDEDTSYCVEDNIAVHNSGCTTKNATGIYQGMISCIIECNDVKKRTFMIADGGIKSPADFCKAIAFGADLVMMGSIIASTKESPAKIHEDGKHKVYNGSASLEIQKLYKEFPKYIEGTTRLLEYTGMPLEVQLSKYIEGLKSSMSYFNAKKLESYRKNISYKYL